MVRKAAAQESGVVGLQGRRLPSVTPHEARLALAIDYTESTIYNPATGEPIKIAAKKVVKFRIAKAMKETALR